MKLAANRQNLKKHAQALLGNEYSPETEKELIKACLSGFERTYGHVSHDRSNHLDKIGAVLHTCGTEGMLLDKQGQDRSGDCSMRDVALDVQYCNSGDSYDLTIMYVNGKLCIGDWGSLVEDLG